ncbi:MAG: adenylate/guanylate cyclase domain-containing protein [Myxococcota bacterium]
MSPDPSFLEAVERARALLQRNGRVSMRALAREFRLDPRGLEELVEELVDVQQIAAREGKILRWVGPPVPEDAPPTHVPAERRQLTVLFCDLVDSTRLAAGMDPEDWREVVRGYQKTSATVIEGLDGRVAQYLGDGLLVYFGHPRAHEDDAERAVRAGLGIVDAIAEHNRALEAERGIRLAVRVGIHTGPVVVGEIGAGAKRETLALGDTTNVAARLQSEADPDDVVLSSRTLRLVQGLFVTRDLGERELRGHGAVRVHQAIRPSGVRSRLDVAPGGLTPLVARGEEVALLERCFEETAAGRGQALLVGGEAGIGKSRLVQAFRERLAERAHTWLECRASPYDQHSALHPVTALHGQGLGFRPDDPPERRLARLEAGLRAVGFDLAETLPLMAAFHGLPGPGEPGLSPEARRRRTLELLTEWLFRMGRDQPVVLLAEDLHWLDPSTLELFERIVDGMADVKLLLLATYRPEYEPSWRGAHVRSVPLGRLDKEALRALVRATPHGRELPEAWVETIVGRSDGVPLYAEELARAALESDRAAPNASEEPQELVPETLQDSLMARLDRLGPAKEVAQLGAVLGREFPYELLRDVSPVDEPTLRAGLENAVREELLFEHGTPPHATYLFKHALLRDAAYHSLLRATRQTHHRRVADALIEAEVGEAQPELVAHHLSEGRDVERAIDYWQLAGERATRRSANQEAIRHLRHGIELLTELPDGPERKRRELVLQVALGAPLQAASGFGDPAVEHAYARAHRLCREVEDAPQLFQAIFGLTAFYQTRSEMELAYALGRQLLTLAERSGDPTLVMLGHMTVGNPLYWMGRPDDALAHLDQTIARYDPTRHRALAYAYGQDPAVIARTFAALALWMVGYPVRAVRRADEAIAEGREGRHALSLAFALGFAAILDWMRREPGSARARAEELIVLSEEQGFPLWLGVGQVIRGWSLLEGGDESGQALIDSGMGHLAQVGARVGSTGFMAIMAEVHWKHGREDAALGVLELALQPGKGDRSTFFDAELHRLRGEILAFGRSRAVGKGEKLMRRALDVARSQGARSLELRAATTLARLLRDAGRGDEGRALLAPIHAWFREGHDAEDLRQAAALLES